MVFTCLIEVRDNFHLSQHHTSGPEYALRDGVAALPYDDGTGPFDEELDWLHRVGGGSEPVELLPVAPCQGVWLWLGGARHEPQYIAYIVRTDTSPDFDIAKR